MTGTRAVVLGAGMAGLAAARVLINHFDEVVLLERDSIDTEEQGLSKRRGVPQYSMPHALLMGGLHAMESLFPGFKDELVAAGAARIDWLKQFRTFDCGEYNKLLLPDAESPMEGVCSTRVLLERTFRRRVLSLPRLTLRAGAPAAGLRLSPDGARVTGVQLRGGEALRCELLVDASGRGSRLPEWLAAEGRPLEGLQSVVVDSGLGYAARTLAMPPNWLQEKGWLACSVFERPNGGRQAFLLPVEGNCWQLILAGRAGDHPPADEDGFLEFAHTLPAPDVYDVLGVAQPRGPIRQYKRTANERRHYEHADMPDGVVVLGDAACCFNPIYGQGMTVGILGALALQEVLSARLAPRRAGAASITAALAGLAKEFQPRLAKVQDYPWNVATADDQAFLAARGEIPPLQKSVWDKCEAWYALQAIRVALTDMAVAKQLFCVQHLAVPPSALFAPAIAASVARLLVGDACAALTRRGGPGKTCKPPSLARSA